MAPKRLSPERLAQIREVYIACDYNQRKAAELLNLSRSTLQHHVYAMGIEKPDEALAEVTVPSPDVDERVRERRLEQELSSFKKREKALLDRLMKAEEYRTSVLGLAGDRLDPARLIVEPPRDGRAETAILVLSDIHDGEYINPAEFDGLNSFDPDICEARLNRTFQVAADLLTKHWPGPPPARLIVALLGDIVNGMLHFENVREDKMRPMESVRHVSGILASGMDLLLSTVDCPIDVVSVVGNHGRGSMTKPEASGVAVESYDTLVSDFLEMHYRGNKRVTFYVPPGPDALISIYGYRFLLTHGDRLGTGGGKGFVGAELPILRGFQKVHMDYAMRGIILDHVICGHFHTALSAALGTSNGCLPGPNSFSQSNRLRPSPPMQAFITVHPDHCITQTRWIKPAVPAEGTMYEPPAPLEDIRPRYRVKAVSIG